MLTKLLAIPLLSGLQTGVLICFRPGDLTMRRVSSIDVAVVREELQRVLRLDRIYGAESLLHVPRSASLTPARRAALCPAMRAWLECGYYVNPHSRRVAVDAAYRLMKFIGLLPPPRLPGHWRTEPPPAQEPLDVTHAVVARSMDVGFAADFGDLERMPMRGTVIAYNDGEGGQHNVRQRVLVIPSLRQLRPGVTVVRVARRRDIAS